MRRTRRVEQRAGKPILNILLAKELSADTPVMQPGVIDPAAVGVVHGLPGWNPVVRWLYRLLITIIQL